MAALAALEFRKDWRPGQTEYVLLVAQTRTQEMTAFISCLACSSP